MSKSDKPAAPPVEAEPQAPIVTTVSSGLNESAAKMAESILAGNATAVIEDLGDGRVRKTVTANGEKIVMIMEEGKKKWTPKIDR